MKQPTDVLRREHVVILQALGVLEAATERLEAGALLPEGWWSAALDWLRTFADSSHHAKEEAALFPAMSAAGIPVEGGPIGTMLEEHAEGRELIRRMAGGHAAARTGPARDYVTLLRAHIDKENEVLFPLADAVLDEPARAELGRQFAVLVAEEGGERRWDEARAALERLEAALLGAGHRR
jgi:hemerythrin-like domain-containing protein